MNNIIRNILVATFVMLCGSVCAYASSDYDISDDMIIKYNGNADVVTVPSVIDGIEIVGIDTNAFQNKDMHTVIIEEGIEFVQRKAFIGCENLQYVKSPESMLLINENAFFECPSLWNFDVSENTHIIYNEPVSVISETDSEAYNGFLYSEGTITGYTGEDAEIIIPETINDVTITAIGQGAFQRNTVITSVTIPDTVTTIGDNAFEGCTALTEVTLPKTLTSSGNYAFSGCTSLIRVTVPGSLKKISDYMFYGCLSLVDVVLEEGVEKTSWYTFCDCAALKTVSVPSTLKSVGVWSFGNCLLLEAFPLPEGLTSIESAAFYRCKKITNIVMPDTVTSMGTHAFRGCSGLTNLKLSENISAIPYRALNGCGFSEIKIPQNVRELGDDAFYQCQKLTSIQIPDNVTSIGKNAFYGCFRLTECIIYGEEVTFGTDPFLNVADGCKIWIPEKSDTLASAKEKGISYSLIKNYATVADQRVFINGNEIFSDTDININEGDIISVKYRLITADDTDNTLFFSFLRLGSGKQFLGFEPFDVSISRNSYRMLEESFEVTDEEQVKIILFNSISGLNALCSARSLKASNV